jgi:hypothetical protein
MAEPTKIRRRIHEAALLLIDELGGDQSEARNEAYGRSMRAKEMGLKVEWQHWGAVAAYLAVIDSGAEFDIQG